MRRHAHATRESGGRVPQSHVYRCLCCGHLVLNETPGSYEIFPVRFWEDDPVQFRWPTLPGGATKVSLIKGQRNFQILGACDERGQQFVRPSAADELLAPAWCSVLDKPDRYA
ncbi:CPCC family cysteine-rich protein [Streptomyces sp. NPDC003996]